MEELIKTKIIAALQPLHFEIENESHKHASGLGAESHFKVFVVATGFASMSRVQRQRFVYELLTAEMKTIHALSLRLLTPEEVDDSQVFSTPDCQSKR